MTDNVTADETSTTTHGLWFGIALADVIAFIGLCLTVALIYLAQRRVERTQGFEIKYHATYAITAASILILAPFELRSSLFSPFAVMVVGSVYPIYESIYAVCTIDGGDDTLWLQYWVAQGSLSFATGWIDDLEPSHWQQRWFEFEFFFMLWLSLPWTNGAALLQTYVTTPMIEPTLRPIVARMDDWLSKFVLMAVNAMHLWVLWAAFEFLPASWKRTIWICIGVIFPVGSSMVAVVSPDSRDDTFWLTYWATFGILFLIVDLLDDFIGFIPGYYTVAIFITVYLMVPMFQGADKIFRHVLVPLSGLQEMLIKKDAELIKYEVMKGIPEERRDTVLKEIAESYLAGNTKATKAGYSSIDVV